MLDRKDLFRVIRVSEDEFYLCDQDKDIKKNSIHGRSAYMCKSMECFSRSKKIKAFEHSFKSNRAQKVYSDLLYELKKVL